MTLRMAMLLSFQEVSLCARNCMYRIHVILYVHCSYSVAILLFRHVNKQVLLIINKLINS